VSLPQVTIVGTVVADPELRFAPSGSAVTNFRVAANERRKDKTTGEWVDGSATFTTCNVWRQQAENVAQTFARGMRVFVTGRLKQREFETREGEKRTVFELEVDECGPTLAYATAVVAKASGSGGGQGPESRPTSSSWPSEEPGF
jgi:single-strand DNA-binding protein